MKPYPFCLGTTSYIIPDDILPNARYLAGQVRDIELILFEVDDGPNNLPSPEVIDQLAPILSDAGKIALSVLWRSSRNGQAARTSWPWRTWRPTRWTSSNPCWHAS